MISEGERLNNVEAAVEHVAVRLMALEYVAEELLARTLTHLEPGAAQAVLDGVACEEPKPWAQIHDGDAALAAGRRAALDAAIGHVLERLKTLLNEQRYPLVQWRDAGRADLNA